jgi:acetyltransferase-like isoleucine patch superfamily enzyme
MDPFNGRESSICGARLKPMKFNSRNLSISSKAKIGRNVKIGDNSTVYDNVELGDNSIVCNDCVLGEPLNAYYRDLDYENPPLVIGPNSLIRSHTIIYAGCTIGAQFSTGHRVTIRENCILGESCLIGTLSDLQGNVRIGRYCRLHSSVHVSQTCSLGDFVFMYPFSVMTNDACPPSADVKGGHIGSYSQIGVHAVILPGIQVGENCLVAANSVVTKRLEDFSLAMGDPARVVMDIRKYVVMGKGHPYPWMKRFERGMPWEGIGYDAWIQQSSKK